MRFRDRRGAGRILAARPRHPRGDEPIVLGLPRGGVVVAREVANGLHAPLDALPVQQIRIPRRPEPVFGAVGEREVVVKNPETIRAFRVTPGEFGRASRSAKTDLARRAALYRQGHHPPRIAGRTVVLVDDGIATGATARAAIQVLRALQAGRIILAVPVAPLDVLRSLSPAVDQTVCALPLRRLGSIGAWYTDFGQVD